MEVGDRVRPVPTFNFNVFGGPESLDDVGTVIEVYDDGDVFVRWGVGGSNVHVVEGSDYHLSRPGSFEDFGVIPA